MEEKSNNISSLSCNNDDNDILTIRVGETGTNLNALGPIIINSDGTTARVENWTSMTQQEKGRFNHHYHHDIFIIIYMIDTATRLISARNKRRIEQLKQEQANNSINDNSSQS